MKARPKIEDYRIKRKGVSIAGERNINLLGFYLALEEWAEEAEQKNNKLIEALKAIERECDNNNPTHENIWRIAEQALKK